MAIDHPGRPAQPVTGPAYCAILNAFAQFTEKNGMLP